MTPNLKYNSNSVPFGGVYVDVYRPTAQDANGNPNASVKLGIYLMESHSPKRAHISQDRPDTDGGDNGWSLVAGKVEGSATFQRNVNVTPTLDTGDYFDVYYTVDQNGNPVAGRFVIMDPDWAKETGYRKMACTTRLDQFAPGALPAVSPRNAATPLIPPP
jgi:hypothetical protein